MTQLYAKTVLVSLSASSDAINMGVNSATDTGLLYACLGGIQCFANNNFNGVMVAGGAGSSGGIMAGSGNSFDITFTPGAIQGRNDFMFTPSSRWGRQCRDGGGNQ